MIHWSDDPAFIQKTRKRLGLTQADMAAQTGLKPSRIGDIEGGRRSMTSKEKGVLWHALVTREILLREHPSVPIFMTLTKLLDDGKYPSRKDVSRLLARLEELTETEAVSNATNSKVTSR